MHILDCYSLNCGLKIREPFIYERFFPLNVDKYITLDTSSTFPSRQYDYWSEVLNILIPILESENIKLSEKLNNKNFRDKAPKTVIEKFESDHEDLKSKLNKQKSLLKGLEKFNN